MPRGFTNIRSLSFRSPSSPSSFLFFSSQCALRIALHLSPLRLPVSRDGNIGTAGDLYGDHYYFAFAADTLRALSAGERRKKRRGNLYGVSFGLIRRAAPASTIKEYYQVLRGRNASIRHNVRSVSTAFCEPSVMRAHARTREHTLRENNNARAQVRSPRKPARRL